MCIAQKYRIMCDTYVPCHAFHPSTKFIKTCSNGVFPVHILLQGQEARYSVEQQASRLFPSLLDNVTNTRVFFSTWKQNLFQIEWLVLFSETLLDGTKEETNRFPP